jgi:hypothetical protein
MSYHFPRKGGERLEAYIRRLQALPLRREDDRRIRDELIAEAKKMMRKRGEGRPHAGPDGHPD